MPEVVVSSKELLGVVAMFSRYVMPTEDIDHIVGFANQAAIAVKNARIFSEVNELKNKLQTVSSSILRSLRSICLINETMKNRCDPFSSFLFSHVISKSVSTSRQKCLFQFLVCPSVLVSQRFRCRDPAFSRKKTSARLKSLQVARF